MRKSNLVRSLSPQDFAITDADYGVTGEIHRCNGCGFMQCSDCHDVLPYYERLEDESYEVTRGARTRQATVILQKSRIDLRHKTLLDIGAASGILVEQAIKLGARAEGIEPSKWLHNKAAERNLPVHLGTLPHAELRTSYDVVCLIDIIEHVPNPVMLLKQVRSLMGRGSYGIMVTPDINSLAARILGWKWWHYRVAHIGYFNKKTLSIAMARSGLKPIRFSRTQWYFPISYLITRVRQYLPSFLQIRDTSLFSNMTVRLNLFDSYLVVFSRGDEHKKISIH